MATTPERVVFVTIVLTVITIVLHVIGGNPPTCCQ